MCYIKTCLNKQYQLVANGKSFIPFAVVVDVSEWRVSSVQSSSNDASLNSSQVTLTLAKYSKQIAKIKLNAVLVILK